MAVESEENEYDSIFALMAQSDDDEDDDNSEDALTLELGEAEQTRDDPVVCVVDLKETICELVKEKFVLTEKIANIEHERDDLVVVAVDYKETIENFNKDKEALVKRVIEIEEERDGLLIVIADLRETVEGLATESKHENSRKGKEVASEAHIRLENALEAVRTSLCVETEKNSHLQTELERVKNDLKKSLKWTWSSEAITAMYVNNGGNRQGIWFQREKIPYNPHNNLLSVSRIYDKGNKVEFLSNICTVTNLVTGEVVLVAKRYKNIYVANFESIQSGDLSCLKVVDDDVELWHRRLGHPSFSLLNKLIQKDLVRGLPMSKFEVKKVCDAYARGKHVKSSFKSKKDVSTSKPLDLLHIDLCGPMRVKNRGGKRYILVIVDDYSNITWTLFLKAKDETFEVFVDFVKKIQVKMESRVASPRTPQQNGVVERKNRTLEEMARTMLIDNGISKNFCAEVVNTVCYLEQLGKFDAKSDEGILLGYSSQRKAYKIYNKRTQCVEESVHVILDESYHFYEKSTKDDQDGEPLLVPGEVIDMTNGKADMMSQVKEPSGDNAASSSREPGTSITATKAEERVVDTLQETGKNLLIVQVYVDDIIFWATADSLCEEFAKLIGSEFEMNIMGELNFFLGLQVKQSTKDTFICQ
ncbi:uncharacterized protein [Nicotiana sylvestris]|uniref:uncharacterized protein n=1 Tax=Nicotiana sylvestris TaxID=4096 RepID=UPI00388CB5A5